MKKLLTALFSLVVISTANADLTGNATLASDYRYRGISQTQNAMAIQGGVDYAHSTGLYLGNWSSSVSSQLYTSGAGIETDLYAGWKKDVWNGLSVDIGSFNYFYPRAKNGTNTDFDTYELSVGISKGPITFKYGQTLSNYFGTANSKNSFYCSLDLNQGIFEKFSAVAHIGHTDVNDNKQLNYTDWNAGASYDLQGWLITGRYYFNTNRGSGFVSANTINGQRLYKNSFALSIMKSFN